MHKIVCCFVAVLLSAVIAPPASAVEYVQSCSRFGERFFYIPGTNTCINLDNGITKKLLNAKTGATKTGESELAARVGTLEGQVEELQAAQARINSDLRDAYDGSAIDMALDSPDLEGSEHFGVKVNWGTYLGSNAFGITFAGVLAEHSGNRLTLSGGVAFTGSNVGGRAGVQFSW